MSPYRLVVGAKKKNPKSWNHPENTLLWSVGWARELLAPAARIIWSERLALCVMVQAMGNFPFFLSLLSGGVVDWMFVLGLPADGVSVFLVFSRCTSFLFPHHCGSYNQLVHTNFVSHKICVTENHLTALITFALVKWWKNVLHQTSSSKTLSLSLKKQHCACFFSVRKRSAASALLSDFLLMFGFKYHNDSTNHVLWKHELTNG